MTSFDKDYLELLNRLKKYNKSLLLMNKLSIIILKYFLHLIQIPILFMLQLIFI